MHDEFHVVDVDAARGDVGGDQHAHRTAAERGQVAVAGGLREVAVQNPPTAHPSRSAAWRACGPDASCTMNRIRRPAPEARCCASFRLASAPETWNSWSGSWRRRRGICFVDRITWSRKTRLTSLSTPLSRVARTAGAVHGQVGVQDARNTEQDQVRHVVGLVDHGDAHRVHAHRALTHQVLEAAGTGDDDVDAARMSRLELNFRDR